MPQLRDSADQLDKFPLPMATEPATVQGLGESMASISDDIFFAGITEINQKLTKKEFSAVELARAFCDRLEAIGPRYNALALSLRKVALREAKDVDGEIKRERLRGPLQGIPFGAKDLLAYAKHPTTWGAQPYAGQVFDYTATVLKQIQKHRRVADRQARDGGTGRRPQLSIRQRFAHRSGLESVG